MQTQVKQWGNSLAIRIPKTVATEIDIASDSPVRLIVEEGRLIIMPLAEPKPTLADLLAQVTAENRHDEVETGTAVGNEVW